MTRKPRRSARKPAETPPPQTVEPHGPDRIVRARGEYLFYENDEGSEAYVIADGEVDILKSSGDGQILLGTVAKGGMFGELALISNQPRVASARVKSDSAELIVITSEMFERKLADIDPFVRALIDVLTDYARVSAIKISSEIRIS